MYPSPLGDQNFKNFRSTYYSGKYCGITVFTTAFAIERQLLFYTIALPIVDTLNTFGIPTFLRYDTTGTKYDTSLYFHGGGHHSHDTVCHTDRLSSQYPWVV